MTKDKARRLAHANELIKIIAAHGRRFFYSREHDRIAHLYLNKQGRVMFCDAKTAVNIYTHQTSWAGRWRGFSHGGTLHGLVEMMRDYIVKGTPITAYQLGCQRSYDNSNIWGYVPDEMQAVRDEAAGLPIIEGDSDEN